MKPRQRRKLHALKPLAVALATCFALPAYANPTGAQVVKGTAAIQQNGSTLTITNSPNAVINWQSFGINPGETTRFIQESSKSAVLNRVVGSDPSKLLGTLTSNGRVFLINPAGILVGQGAKIDVNGLVASTLNISNEHFLQGNYTFEATPGAGNVTNQGSITTAEGGSVYLIAPNVENSGIITSPKGEVILAAGQSVKLVNSATPGVSIEITAPDGQAVNLGSILAESGRIGMVGATVKNAGKLKADSVHNEGGRIFLKAGKQLITTPESEITANGAKGGTVILESQGSTEIAGKVEARTITPPAAVNSAPPATEAAAQLAQSLSQPASGQSTPAGSATPVTTTITTEAGHGGNIVVSGQQIAVQDNASLDASGRAGGGTVMVGGDLHGTPSRATLDLWAEQPAYTIGTVGEPVCHIMMPTGIARLDIHSGPQLVQDTAPAGGDSSSLPGGPRPDNAPPLNARNVVISAGARLRADAEENGDGGKIIVWADDTTTVNGSISARGGALGGNGGFIETSGLITLNFNAQVDTRAARGATGTLLLDPNSYTVAASGGNMTGAALSASLASNNVTLLSSSGTSGGSGDININDAVSWSANTLTLTAVHDININAVMTASGTSALTMSTNTANGADVAVSGGTVKVGLDSYGFLGRVDFPGRSGTGFLTINGSGYTVINSLGAYGSTTGTDLQGIKGNLSGKFALGGDIDASATNSWNYGNGFSPVVNFNGTLDGLGHVVSNLKIYSTSSNVGMGLLGSTTGGATVRNIGMEGGSVQAYQKVGSLIGSNAGLLHNSYSTASVTANYANSNTGGGLVGYNSGTISTSYASGNVRGAVTIGGLVGSNAGTITQSYATGSVSKDTTYAFSFAAFGGLAGGNTGTISQSYAAGTVSASGADSVGGLIGGNYNGTVTAVYAVGLVNGGTNTGGLVGNYTGGTFTNAYWNTATSGQAASAAGSGLSNSQMAAQASFSGWDFSGTWKIVEGYLAPELRVFGNETTNIWTGAADNLSWNLDGNWSLGHAPTSDERAYLPNVAGTSRVDITAAAAARSVIASEQVKLNGSGLTLSLARGASFNAGLELGLTGALDIAGPKLTISGTRYTVVQTLEQLQNISLYGYYALGNDLDASATASWNSGAGFKPLGTISTFDGLGHAIDNLTINRPGEDNVALFTSATVRNLDLTDASISGRNGVAGFVHGGSFSDGYFSGALSGTSGIGPLLSNGTLTNAHYDIDATTINGQHIVSATGGGLYHTQFQAWLDSGKAGLAIADYSSLALDGDGYYVISSLQGMKDLLGFADNSSYKFRLGADLDFSALPGFMVPKLSGSAFDGAGHTLSNLTIDQPGINNVGLFGVVNSATLRDLTLDNFTVTGASNVGALTGYSGGNITNVTVTADVTSTGDYADRIGVMLGYGEGIITNAHAAGSVTAGKGADSVGGLVGGLHATNYATTVLIDSSSSATVTAGDNAWGGGGLAGYVYGKVTGSHASGNVTAGNDARFVAGLIGAFDGRLDNGYATGNVSAGLRAIGVGGLVGLSDWDIVSNSHATGNVMVGDNARNIGGLVGESWGSATITTSHSAGTVTAGASSYNVGGLAGYNEETITRNTTTSNVVVGANSYNVGGLVGKNYYGSINYNASAGSVTAGAGSTVIGQSIGGAWWSADSNNFYNADTSILTIGSGTAIHITYGNGLYGRQFQDWIDGGFVALDIADYADSLPQIDGAYTISTLQGLKDMQAFRTQGYDFKLAADLDLTTLPGWYLPEFSGNFDGGSHTLDKLSVQLPNEGYVGFIGQLNSGSNISNLQLANATVSGYDWAVGGLIGRNYGSIDQVTVEVTLTAAANSNSVGGLVGDNEGSISNSHASGSVTVGSNSSSIGGLVGFNDNSARIENSSAAIAIIGGSTDLFQTGGLAGWNAGSISNSHASGNITAGTYGGDIGGLVGYLANGATIVNSYATGNISAGDDSYELGGLVGGTSGATISYSFATGNITAGARSNALGGLVGYSYGPISSVYATGAVTGGSSSARVGGLVGQNGGAISDAYSSGAVSGTTNVGGLIGLNNGSVSRAYWDTETSTQATSAGGAGLTSAQMKSQASFAGWDFVNDWQLTEGVTAPTFQPIVLNTWTGAVDGDWFNAGNWSLNHSPTAGETAQIGDLGAIDRITFSGTATVKSVIADEAFLLSGAGSVLTLTRDGDFLGGLTLTPGSRVDLGAYAKTFSIADESYGIVRDLTALQAMTSGSNYVLGNDIDASDSANWNAGAGFQPLGMSSTHFDGLGHAITGLTINRPTTTNVGLFAGFNYGQIRNLRLSGFQVSGDQNVGALAGDIYNGVELVNVALSSGSVSGNANVGGLVGYREHFSAFSLENSHYDVQQVAINGSTRVTEGGIYHAQYQDWAAGSYQPLTITDYLTADAAGRYQLNSTADLQAMLPFATDGAMRFVLTTDIDFASTPLTGWQLPELAGSLDGGGHTLSHYTLNVVGNFVGLVGRLVSGGEIVDLGLADASVSGRDSIGALVGHSRGGAGQGLGHRPGAGYQLRRRPGGLQRRRQHYRFARRGRGQCQR